MAIFALALPFYFWPRSSNKYPSISIRYPSSIVGAKLSFCGQRRQRKQLHHAPECAAAGRREHNVTNSGRQERTLSPAQAGRREHCNQSRQAGENTVTNSGRQERTLSPAQAGRREHCNQSRQAGENTVTNPGRARNLKLCRYRAHAHVHQVGTKEHQVEWVEGPHNST